MPPELPIIIQRSMTLDLALGGALAVLCLSLGWRVLRTLRVAGGGSGSWAALVLAACGLVLGILIAIRSAGWEFLIDKDGVALLAPFDFSSTTTRIAWQDLDSVWVAAGGYRGPSFKLHLHGRKGQEIVLQNADRLPGSLLQDVLTANAVSAKGVNSIADQINAAANSMSWSISSGYRLRPMP